MEQIENRPGFIRTKEGSSVDEGIQDEIRGLLAGLPWAYVARLDKATITECTLDLPNKWAEGRAFGPGVEVRWRRMGADRYRLDVLGEDLSAMPSGNGWQPLAEEINGVRKHRTLLWGTLSRADEQPTDWREVRIPNPLEYPFLDPDSDKPRVAVDGWDYLVDGVVVATRWARLYQSKPREED